MFVRLRRDERGVAMVVALGVAFVVMLLATVIFTQAIHNSNESAYGRRRLTAVSAAEAGLNYWYNYIQNTAPTSISTAAVTRSLGSSPATSSFTATPTFYSDTAGTNVFTGTITSSSYPLSVKVKSVGTVNGVSRTMESFASFRPVYGGLNEAVISNLGTSFSNNFQINGNSGNDGDVYILNGDLSISTTPVIYGSVYVPNGSLTMSNSTQIKGNAWANGNMTLTTVGGYAKSTSGNISGGTVAGDCTASGSITSTCAHKYPSTTPGAVPTQTFPQITSDTSAWTSAGYSLMTFSGATACTDAYDWIHNTGSGTWATSGLTDVVIRITTACNFINGNNDTNTIRGNLAILSDGSFTFAQLSNWNGVSSPAKNVYFASTYTGSACSGTTKDLTVGNNTNFDANVNVFFYTPCTATMNNTNSFAGQVIANSVNLGNLFTMTYKPIVVPGSNPTNYNQDIAYIREVI